MSNPTLSQRLSAFIRKYGAVPNVGDTPINRGQCVGLVQQWIDTLALPHVWGNAKDLLANAPVSSYRIFHNSPTNYPSPGDIVVWGESWGGGYGHTGIAVTGHVMDFTAFEQNDPPGSAPRLKVYSYDGVIGWLRPRVNK